MMRKGHIRRVFPGANTARGFVSFYDYLCFPRRERLFVMKGGPGVGKSTFMRSIGNALADEGFDIEFHNCSSDNGSLDGIYAPALGVGVLDGTAPHTVDPKHPGAIDEIVLLGDYWNQTALHQKSKPIIDGFTENARLFKVAYSCLAAAQVHLQEYKSYYCDMGAIDMAGLYRRARELADRIFAGRFAQQAGPSRHLFASAITPSGPLNYLETISDIISDRYLIKGDSGTGKSKVMKLLFDEAVQRGFYTEAFHCSLDSDDIEHIVLPELHSVILTSEFPHNIDFAKDVFIMTIDTDLYVDTGVLARVRSDMDTAKQLYRSSLSRAVTYIARAKENHDALETFYIPNMDFAGVSAKRDEVMAKIRDRARLSV